MKNLKKNMLSAAVLTAVILMSACNRPAAPAVQETPTPTETPVITPQPEPTPSAPKISLVNLEGLQFEFSSGAGGWGTELTISEEGIFTGSYHDSEMGSTGEDYPNGTVYRCDFQGKLRPLERVDNMTYKTTLAELVYLTKPGTTEIVDGIRYCYVTPYGLDDAGDLMIYLPGSKTADLPEGFLSWVNMILYDYNTGVTADTIDFYGLYNVDAEAGFYSYTLYDQVKESIAFSEYYASSIRDQLQTADLTQVEMNEKAQELFETWDASLNYVWGVLADHLSEGAMSNLIKEERAWITMKDKAVEEAAAEYAGGSMAPMVASMKAAELTEARVYELLEMLKY